MRFPALLACTTALTLTTPAVALAAPTPLDEIIVTASRRAEAVRDVPASVSTLSRAEFEAKATRFIGEELRGLPGLVLRTNDAGTYTDITIRGVPNRIHNDTLVVLMDGVPFVTGDDEVDLEQLPFGAAGRVDLVRGPMSALYGRGAIAGTINYLTREVGEEVFAQIEGGLGSHGWRRVGALAQTPTMPGGALLLAAEVQRGDGWRDRTGREEESLFAKHRLGVGDWGRLTLTGSWVRTDQNLAGELPVDRAGELVPLPGGRRANWNMDDAGFAKRMLTGTAILEAGLAPGLTGTTRLHARRSDTRARQGFFIPFQPGQDWIGFTGFQVDGDTDTLFAEQQLNWTLGPVALVGGISAEQVEARHVELWEGELDDGFFFAQRRSLTTGAHLNRGDWARERLLDADSRARTLAAYLQGDVDVGPVTLSAGARFDRFSRDVTYAPDFNADAAQRVEDTDQRVSPKLSARWRLTDTLMAYAAYGEGFSPGFGPLWSFRNRDTGLDPELARNVEAGVKGSALDGRVSGTVTVYQLTRRDLLQLLPVNGTAQTINTGRQRSRGVEAEVAADLGDAVPGLTLSASYGFTDAVWTENRFLEPFSERPFDFTGRKVAGVPRHAGRATAAQGLPAWGVVVEGWADLVGDYWYDPANSVRSGGHATLGAAITWTPAALPGLDLTATVRNLLDRRVLTVTADNDGPLAAFPQPPRELFLTARMSF